MTTASPTCLKGGKGEKLTASTPLNFSGKRASRIPQSPVAPPNLKKKLWSPQSSKPDAFRFCLQSKMSICSISNPRIHRHRIIQNAADQQRFGSFGKAQGEVWRVHLCSVDAHAMRAPVGHANAIAVFMWNPERIARGVKASDKVQGKYRTQSLQT